MQKHAEFGFLVGRHVFSKTAAPARGAAAAGEAIGGALGSAGQSVSNFFGGMRRGLKGEVPPPLPAPAAAPARAASGMTSPPLPLPAPALRPRPGVSPPPLPGNPAAAPARGQGAMAADKVTISPAEAASGRATVKLTPQELAQMRQRNAAGMGYSMPANAQPVAVRLAQQNARANVLAGGGTPQDVQRVMAPTAKEFEVRRRTAARMADGSLSPPPLPSPPARLSPRNN